MIARAVQPLLFAALAAGLAFTPGRAAAPAGKAIRSIGLSKPFATRTPWRFAATQTPDEPYDDFGMFPGRVSFCLKHASDRACSPAIREMEKAPDSNYDYSWQPHYLNAARLVYPRGRSAPPLLLLQTQSLPSSGDGEAAVYTQLIAYRRATDRFEPAFTRLVFHNNNQEVRYIAAGKLQGDVIVAEPTDNAPYGYWVTVERLDPATYRYRPILKYRSATMYGDNNPLEVIDSEMPNIQHRLGLWRPDMPLPLPVSGCTKPRLIKMELWCS